MCAFPPNRRRRIFSTQLLPKAPYVYRQLLAALVALAAVFPTCPAPAAELAPPTGPVVLTVSGNITETTAGDRAEFDLDALKAMPQHEVTTSTAWTDGVSTFAGPLLCDVLDAVGAEGTVLRATALNDYATEVPIEDCRTYPVILAIEQDGEPLPRRGKGPIWIVYPQDEFPELQTAEIFNRWVWQLAALEVR